MVEKQTAVMTAYTLDELELSKTEIHRDQQKK